MDQCVDRQVGEFIAAIEERELHEKIDSGNSDIEVASNQFDGGGHGSAGGKHIVDNQDFLAGPEGIGVDFDGIGSVFELVGLPVDGVGQLSGFAHQAGSGTQGVGEGGGENKPARLVGMQYGIEPNYRKKIFKN